MAVVTTKSTLIANRDAVPKVTTDSFIAGGILGQCYGFVTAVNGDSAGSQYRMLSVPSNARLSSIECVNASLGSGCILDVSVWYPPTIPVGGGAFLSSALAGTLISSSALAASISANTATTGYTNQFTTAVLNPAQQEQCLWQMVGLTADPEFSLDIGLTVRAAVATSGYVGLKASFMF